MRGNSTREKRKQGAPTDSRMVLAKAEQVLINELVPLIDADFDRIVGVEESALIRAGDIRIKPHSPGAVASAIDGQLLSSGPIHLQTEGDVTQRLLCKQRSRIR